MRRLLILGLVVVASLSFPGCGGKPPAATGPQQPAPQPLPGAAVDVDPPAAPNEVQPVVAQTAALIQPTDWLARYEAAWKDSPDRVQNDNPRSVLTLGMRIPSAAERGLLKDLAAQPVATRMQVLQQILAAAQTRSDLPIEYAAHAAASGNPTTRQQIITEVVKPFAARSDLNATEKTVLCRLAIELEAIADVPELAVPVVEYLLSLRPEKPISGNPAAPPDPAQVMPTIYLSKLLTNFSARAPESQRHEVLTAVHKVLGLPPPPEQQQLPIAVTHMPDGQPPPSRADQERRQFQSQFERLTRSFVEDRRQKPKPPPEVIASLKDPNTPISTIAQILPQLEPGDVQLTPADIQQIGSRALQHAVKPESDATTVVAALRITHGSGATVSTQDAVALVEKIAALPAQNQQSQLELQIGLGGIIERMDRAGVAPVLSAISKIPNVKWEYFNSAVFTVATPAEAKALVREFVPQWNEKNQEVLNPLLLLADQTDPVDRDKFHLFLIAKIKGWPVEEKIKRNYFDRFADQFAKSKELSAAAADALLELAFPPDKAQRAGGPVPRKTQAVLLASASPEVRARYLSSLGHHLQPSRVGFADDYSGQFALDTLSLLSEKLTAQEAQSVTAAITEQLPKMPMVAYPALARYIAGRPAVERAPLVKLILAAAEPRPANNSSFDPSQPAKEMASSLEPNEAAELLKTALAQPLPGQFNLFRNSLLLALAGRVARDQQPALGTALAQRIQQAKQPSEQIILADLALAMPQGLSADQQVQVAGSLLTTFLTALKPTPDPMAPAVDIPPPRPDAPPADFVPPQPAQPAGTPFDQDTIGQARIQQQLCQLIAGLPADRSRPLVQQLLAASEKLNDRLQFSIRGPGQAGSERVGLVLPVFTSFPGEFAPAELSRLTTVYAKFAIFNGGRELKNIQEEMEKLPGALPPAAGAKLVEDIARLLADRDQGRALNVREGLEVLGFIAARLAPADVEPAAKHVQALEKPSQFAQPIPVHETLAKFAERLPPTAASAWIDQYQAAAAQNPMKREAADAIIVAALQPLAADPAAFLARLQTLKLSPIAQRVALRKLGKGTDPAKLANLLATEKSLFDFSTPQGLDGVRMMIAEVPLSTRLDLVEKLVTSAKLSSGQAAFLAMPSGRDKSTTDRQLKAWLAEPDRVGLRRFAILGHPGGDPNRPTLWQVLE